MEPYSQNSWNSPKSPNLFDRIKNLLTDKKVENGGFNECPSILFDEDCNALKERFIILLTSNSPFTADDPRILEAQWGTTIRLIDLGLNHFGRDFVMDAMKSVYWDSQLEKIGDRMPHIKN